MLRKSKEIGEGLKIHDSWCKMQSVIRSRLFGTQRRRVLAALQRTATTDAEAGQRGFNKINLLLLAPAVTFGLGTWQVYRLQWKKNLIKELETKTNAEPVDLPLDPEQHRAMIYRRVKVIGEFDHEHEMFLGPRPINKQVQGMATNEVGYHVITPFKLLDSGERILLNRGWIPKRRLSVETRKDAQIQGPVEIVGIIRKPEKRPPFINRNEPERNKWHYIDLDHMGSYANTLPIMVDSDAASSVPGGPLGGQTRVTLRNEHLSYIITWYALSAATLYLYYNLRKRPAAMFSKGPR